MFTVKDLGLWCRVTVQIFLELRAYMRVVVAQRLRLRLLEELEAQGLSAGEDWVDACTWFKVQGPGSAVNG